MKRRKEGRKEERKPWKQAKEGSQGRKEGWK